MRGIFCVVVLIAICGMCLAHHGNMDEHDIMEEEGFEAAVQSCVIEKKCPPVKPIDDPSVSSSCKEHLRECRKGADCTEESFAAHGCAGHMWALYRKCGGCIREKLSE